RKNPKTLKSMLYSRKHNHNYSLTNPIFIQAALAALPLASFFDLPTPLVTTYSKFNVQLNGGFLSVRISSYFGLIPIASPYSFTIVIYFPFSGAIACPHRSAAIGTQSQSLSKPSEA